jgi:hypothetical protein
MDENPLDKPISLNEEKAIRGALLLRGLHVRERSLWRKSPNEVAALFGLDAIEVAGMAGRR